MVTNQKRHLTKEDMPMKNKHMKRYLAYINREWPIKTTISYHDTPIRLAKIQNTNTCEDTVQEELSFNAGGVQSIIATLRQAVSYKTKHTRITKFNNHAL